MGLRHPGLSRVLEVGADGEGQWVAEAAAGAYPLSDERCQRPRGQGLALGLLRVLEGLAYLHRHGLAHGAVSRDAIMCDGRRAVLAGWTRHVHGEADVGERAADTRAWAAVAAELLADRTDALSGLVLDAAELVEEQRAAPERIAAPRVARAIRNAWGGEGNAAGGRGIEQVTSDGSQGMLAKIVHFVTSLLVGAATSVVTGAVVVGAVALGVLWFMDQLPAEVQVPNLVGMPRAEAIDRLGQVGLKVGNVRRVYREEYKAGEVAGTRPEPRMIVREGREVTLIVSQGPARVRVPRVIGLTEGEAKRALADTDLRVEHVGRVRSAAPPGEIVQQDPSSGQKVARGDRVSVKTSGGPDYAVVRVDVDDDEDLRVFFRRIEVVVPHGEPLQRVQILEGHAEPLDISYDRLHRPGERIKFDTWGRSGKRLVVRIEDETVYRTQI